MTTSTTEYTRDGVQEEEWESDTIAETNVETVFGPSGRERIYSHTICDITFDDAVIKSDKSYTLTRMR